MFCKRNQANIFLAHLMPELLENAIMTNDQVYVEQRLNQFDPVPANSVNEALQTGLMIACQHKSLDTVKVFLEKSTSVKNDDPSLCNVNQVDASEWTALHFAVQCGSLECVKLLIEHRAVVDAKTHKRETPLHFAAQNNCYEIVNLLIENKADINARTDKYETALHITAKNNSFEALKLLIENNADIEATTEKRKTSLHIAAQNNCFEVVKLLIKYKADINARTNTKETALHIAAEYNFFNIVQILVRNNAYIDATTQSNETALFLAAKHNHPDIVELLAAHNCQLQTKSNRHENDEYEWKRSGREHFKDKTALELSVEENFEETAKHLLFHLARKKNMFRDDQNALMRTEMEIRTEKLKEEELNLLLVQAAERGHNKIANELLVHGANVKYSEGITMQEA
jgi:ankyrin repeat protein